MKKQILILSAMYGLSCGVVIAQTNSAPNGNFESWTSSTFDVPQNFAYSSNQEAFRRDLPFNVVKSTDKCYGSYAAKLTTISAGSDTLFAYMVNEGNPNGNPDSWHGGLPYSQKPTGISGYYKSAIPIGDTALIVAAFSKGGVNIGTYIVKLYGTHTSCTAFTFNLSPALAQIPDSLMLAVTSSQALSNIAIPGSTITLDSISFTGVTSQPSWFDGNFETWQSTTLDKPTNWYSGGGSSNNPNGGVSKTTDAVTSSYAIELITYEGDNNGVPRAQGAYVSTGYYDCPNNSGPCTQQGGYPFSNQIDTLAFSYKYVPMGNDSAVVFLDFRKNSIGFGSTARVLNASANYQYTEIPFNVGQVPDSVIIGIQSSYWSDTLLSFVGSNLKIDNIHFKSQPLVLTGITQNNRIDNYVRFYPNPIQTSGIIEINPQINIEGAELRIYDVIGRTIKRIVVTEHKMTVDRTDLSGGIYFYELITNYKVLTAGKIIVE